MKEKPAVEQFNLPTAGCGVIRYPRIPMATVNEPKQSVKDELLILLRNAYFEGFDDAAYTYYGVDAARNIGESQRKWIESDTCRLSEANLNRAMRPPNDPPHHRLDPSQEQPRESIRPTPEQLNKAVDEARERVSQMSPDEKAELLASARKRIAEGSRQLRSRLERFNAGHKPEKP